MDMNEVPAISTALARRMREGATSHQVASEVVGLLQGSHATLAPIIGTAGVVALYRRSLLLAARSYPWLADLLADSGTAFDVEALTAALAGQEGDAAALGGGLLIETFYRLLSGVIGPTLTRKLLPFLWRAPLNPVLRKAP
jgi:hypothetical protein